RVIKTSLVPLSPPLADGWLARYSLSAGLDHAQAAAYAEGLTRHVGGVVGGQEGDGGGDLVGLTQTLHLGSLFHRLNHLLADLAELLGAHQQRRLDRARRDRVGGDPVASVLAGDRLHEGDDAALGGRIDGGALRANPARLRGGADDPSVARLLHPRQHGVGAGEDTAEVDREYALPLLTAGVSEEAELVGAGVVDEDVEGSGLLHRRLGRLEVGHVECQRVAVDLARNTLGALRVDLADPDLGALRRGPRGDRRADPAGPAGDQCLSSLQSHRAEHRLAGLGGARTDPDRRWHRTLRPRPGAALGEGGPGR